MKHEEVDLNTAVTRASRDQDTEARTELTLKKSRDQRT